ncbi:MAG: hypothetical protein JW955_18690 [Sedimentisphaerales bacterium]|nr:hypothetical protein [Sedimentisphaerales bacterium]
MRMKNSDFVISVLAMVFALALASQAQERAVGGPPVFRPEVMQEPQPPMPPIQEYARQLYEQARLAQELADRLRRQAEELDQMARRGPMPNMGPGPGPMDPMQRELMEIKEAVGRAEREGRHEQAADLRNRAEQLMKEMRSRQKGPQRKEPAFQEIRERIEQLQNQAREAQDARRAEEAQRLREEAEAVEMKMRTEREVRNMAAHAEALIGKVMELRKQAEQAKREGRGDEAAELAETAADVERQVDETKHKIERFKMESQIKHMHMMAEWAERRGDMEKAEALAREGRELEQRLHDPDLERGPGVGGDELPRIVKELREEVKRLRREMQEMRMQTRERERR